MDIKQTKMDGDTRWKIGCYVAASVIWMASAYFFSYSNPSLAGLFLSVSGLNLVCANKEYRKFKDKEKNLREHRSEKNTLKSNQKIYQNERILSNEDTKTIATNHLANARQKVAKKLGIKTQLPQSIKKIEKAVSDKLFGKVME